VARLSIPNEQLEALGGLVKISTAQLSALLEGLSRVSLPIEPDALEAEVAKLLGPDLPNVETLAKALLALNITYAHAEPPFDEFVNDILSALEQAGQVGFHDDRRSRAKDLITKILSVPTFRTVTKAIHLKLDRERLFNHARILTDARPVYGPDVSAAPQAVLITHTLKISYYQDDKMVDFYLALDEDDIAELLAVLDRAGKKAESLSAVFKAANLRVIRK